MNPEDLRIIISAYQKSRVVLSAFEIGIFTAIGADSKTSKQIAKKVKSDPRAIDRLLNAVCTLNLITKEKDKFTNTEFSQKYLVKDSNDYMEGLMHSVNQWDTWSTLSEVVKAGKSVYKRPANINDRNKKWLNSFIGAMHDRGKRQAPVIVSKLDISKVKQVLDVGGGSGAYAMAFVMAKKGITATVFDLPNVVPITEKYIKKEKLTTLVNTIKGDYHTDSFPKKQDLVFLSAIVHINSIKENEKLLKKVSKSLNKGGYVVIQDHVMQENRVNPPAGALFSLNMLVGTNHGDTYTEAEMKAWFKKAEITFVETKLTPFGNSLVIGKKEK